MRLRRLSLSITIACFLQAASSASAQTPGAPAMPPPHPVPHARSLISVSDCNPQLNFQPTGPYVGYAPVAWRGGYWGDPYGFRYYQPAVAVANPQLAIHYMNISPRTMSTIDFGLVANGRLVAEVRDVGTFSPHAEIKHRFALNPNVFPLQTGLPRCIPLHIIFADGTSWRNPGLPPKNTQIYFNP